MIEATIEMHNREQGTCEGRDKVCKFCEHSFGAVDDMEALKIILWPKNPNIPLEPDAFEVLIWMIKYLWFSKQGKPTEQIKVLREIKALLFSTNPGEAIFEAAFKIIHHDWGLLCEEISGED